MRTNDIIENKCRTCSIVFFVCLAVSIALIIWGFLAPPQGIIDGSVLKAVGELIVFAALAFGMQAVKFGYDLKLTRGDSSIEVHNE